MLADELYYAMIEVGDCARLNQIPGPLARTLIDTAQKSLALWRRDEQAAFRFARMVLLSRPTNLLVATGKLPEPTGSACWRLVRLLEYMATLEDCG